MERLRLKNFKPEKVAPNFLNYLDQRGQVEIGEEGEEVARCGISNKEVLHKGLGKPVKLNGQEIGKLECYIDPPAVVYRGRLPDVQQPKGRGRRSFSQQPVVDENGVAWTELIISYNERHSAAYKEGRNDGWITIPLP